MSFLRVFLFKGSTFSSSSALPLPFPLVIWPKLISTVFVRMLNLGAPYSLSFNNSITLHFPFLSGEVFSPNKWFQKNLDFFKLLFEETFGFCWFSSKEVVITPYCFWQISISSNSDLFFYQKFLIKWFVFSFCVQLTHYPYCAWEP